MPLLGLAGMWTVIKPTRLMRKAGIAGVRRGWKRHTTMPVKTRDHRTDLVNRDFKVDAPQQL